MELEKLDLIVMKISLNPISTYGKTKVDAEK